MHEEKTQVERVSQLLQKPPVSQSPLARMFVSNGTLASFKDISPMYMEIKIPLPVSADPFKVRTDVVSVPEHRLQALGYENVEGTEWLLGSYEIPGAWVEILLEKKESSCHYGFL